ncbi:DUF4350 domain-containing protein [Microbacterium sp. gxy059]|uniref:DUF4350 domain-containing protein n=1 Tax=Microbacterium sp. gxy059 TaxID=2957199 RepID=UPI003D99DB81
MSLLATTAPPDEAPAPSRSRTRRALPWIGLALALVLGGGVLSLVAWEWSQPDPLGAESPRYDGARAVVHVLREQGVEVVEAHDIDAAREELSGGGTLVVTDPWLLSGDPLDELVQASDQTVLLTADLVIAEQLVPGIENGGYATEPVAPGCDLPAAENAPSVRPGRGWALPDGSDAIGCYPVGDGFGLVSAPATGGGSVILLDGREVLANDVIAEDDNAALALGLLGAADRVVWYTPSAGDATSDTVPPTLADLVPGWVTPAIVLLLSAGIAAIVWRGRRFGPLVAETLPVTVRASETLEGRARLYREAGDPAHAADALRRGALRRIAVRLGLPARAGAAEVASAAAAATGRDPRALHDLFSEVPPSDADLARIGDDLRALEDAIDDVRHRKDPQR